MKVIFGGEDISEDGFPLLLFLDRVNDVGGIRERDNRIVVVQLGEVTSELEQ